MLRTTTSVACALLLIVGLHSANAGGKNAKEIVKQVQKRYRQLKSLQAEFKQDFKWELAGETQSVTGRLYLLEGNKYRIETDIQEIVTDGTTVWTFSKKSEQVIIDALDQSQENQLPKDLLFKYAEEYEPVYLGEEVFAGKKCHVLNLLPKEEDALVKSMKIWVDEDKWFTRKIEQTDINDNVNIYVVSNIRDNVELDPALFTFEVKPNYEVVDLRQ